ncbi:hypothetical protein DICPUDRAFT_86658 [Dictyostelium purpureum]|uniref:3-beta hydroxysteroid dehydrogenase/isomerase domain-containing protein n=1 Tax=Dictyostelium purpureum TaxID=5786 RepID=F0ZD49_DICPU|nr:uncharacterized protein DICPUDRAFT_86658 [Dictyostelium purpureum]EGC38141.1 hypothetical protein DICPUDRAFT_86658 [Dictyostelium purpureum]|eukprot:XP_003285355.1 hypothetical protein DICPUDRAFT_86658 [Dictyostelium purpureum]
MKNIFLTGGSGFLGKYIIEELVENGYNVFALSRSNSSSKVMSQLGAQIKMTSLHDEEGLKEAIKGCDVVIHCAAKLETNSDSVEELYRDNCDATELLYKVSKQVGIKVFLFISSEGVIMNGEHINDASEDTPYPPLEQLGWYNKSKAISEQYILNQSSTSNEKNTNRNSGGNNMKSIIVRLPLVWGPRDNVLDYLVGLCNKFQWFWIGGGKNYLSIVHAKNAALGIRLAFEKGDDSDIYHLTDGQPVQYRQFFTDRFLKKNVQSWKLYMSLPIPFAWFLVWFMAIVWKLFNLKGLPLLTKTGLIYSSKNFTILDYKARNKLGFKNKISYNQGMSEL